ncbi:MAG: endoglucanase, partial [Comamonadaceae bacterium]
MQLTTLCQRLALAGCLLATCSGAWSYSINAGKVTDSAGNAVQLRGVNWFGFETQTNVVHGLWARNWKDMITQMQQSGFNAVRLPFCPATLRGNAPNSIDYSRNADLQGLSAIQVMDTIVQELSRRGMYVLLDHHTPDCQSISELWYTPSYSEQQWIADLTFLAQRYGGVAGVIGIDIKN